MKENILLIKISDTISCCFVNNMLNLDHVKDCARASWSLSAARKKQIEYLLAVNVSKVVGAFHVTKVSACLADEYDSAPVQPDGSKQLPNYPEFPPNVRICDQWCARFSTVEEARHHLTDSDFRRFEAFLIERREMDINGPKDLDCYLFDIRRRSYFSLETGNVPDEIKRLVGNDVKVKGRIWKSANPVRYCSVNDLEIIE